MSTWCASDYQWGREWIVPMFGNHDYQLHDGKEPIPLTSLMKTNAIYAAFAAGIKSLVTCFIKINSATLFPMVIPHPPRSLSPQNTL